VEVSILRNPPRVPRALATSLTLLAILSATSVAFAQAPGSLRGRVLDNEENPLPGATVEVVGTQISAVTDVTGNFVIQRLPSGQQTIRISYVGYEALEEQVTVESGRAIRRDFQLAGTPRFEDEIIVVAEPILTGQAKALNQQKTALSIKNIVSSDQMGRFPDPNAAEATQRMPGVTLQRDQGEGRYIIIRGANANLNATSINGVRLPSPESDVRQVALDVVPADILESIEVTKSLTPDMEGDSIGGAVNLVPKQAPAATRAGASLGFGYNAVSESGNQQGSIQLGSRWNDFGMIGNVSALNTERGSDDFEPEYDNGDLAEIQLRDYTINRKRVGVNVSGDYDYSAAGSFLFNTVWNTFTDQEYRRVRIDIPEDGEIERELKDRYESQDIYAISGRGTQLFASGWQLSYDLAYAYANEDEPDSYYSTFIQEDVEFDPNVSAGSIDPDNINSNPLNEDLSEYFLDELSFETSYTRNWNVAGRADISAPFDAGSLGGLLQFGAKFRREDKLTDVGATAYESEDDIRLTDPIAGINTDAVLLPFLDGQYGDLNGFQGAGAMRALLATGLLGEGEIDHEEEAGDFTALEDTFGLYGMAETYLSNDLMILPGVRYEYTDSSYVGTAVVFDEEGDFFGLTDLPGDNSYGVFMPHLHVRYRATPDTNVRTAFNRTLARPQFGDLAPFELILEEDGEIERGNPDLEPTKSWNFDLMAEHFLPNVGVLQGGFFYKDLTDVIFLSNTDEVIDGEEFEVIQPRNADTGTLWGFELAFQNQLSMLPSPIDGIGLYFNYTYVDGEAEIPERGVLELPGQAKHTGNFAVFYEKYGFSGRLALNFHNAYLDEVGDEPEEDLFIDEHKQWDISVSQQVNSHFRVFADFLNLSDAPLRVYEFQVARARQQEYYRWWMVFGIRIDY
jgi:TonB-dependent receptor